MNQNTIAIPEKSEALSESDLSKEKIIEVDEISLAKRTLMTKLYGLEQEIEVFKNDFPNKYSYFLDEIEKLRESYNSSLEEIREQMTFEIDPELNGKMNWDISQLDKEIKKFIDCEVKFSILSKKLQMLITKLNILYNVSISYPSERSKVIPQVARAIVSEGEIVQEFKCCDYILADNQLKERIVTLVSYVDYEIFKTVLRNSSSYPQYVLEHLVLFSQFKDFDYVSPFKAFIEDELSDLGELLDLIGNDEYQKSFDKKITTLFNKITYAKDMKVQLLDLDFWGKVFELESSLLEFLKGCTVVEKDKIKVKIIDRMSIQVNEREVITLPKTNAHLALTSVFSATHDDRILLLIKLIKNVSDEITYKEIYFLLLLFDAIGIIQNVPNELSKHMEKYIEKYPYHSKTIEKRKMYVIKSQSEKQYVFAFALEGEPDKTIKTLESLNIDFKVENGNIYINSFYFNGLENIFTNNPQTTNTQNTTNNA